MFRFGLIKECFSEKEQNKVTEALERSLNPG